jgi:pyruvate formate lyase activating enzyme
MNFCIQKGSRIICNLCSRYCKLSDGQIGYCGVNKNKDGSLENMVYGYVSAMGIDPIEKKPLYHFLPNTQSFSISTVGCNFRCPFCQNHNISQHNNIDRDKYFTPQEIVSMAQIRGARSIAFTYNEPSIFYPFAKDISTIAKSNDIKSVFVSNGYESKEVINDMVGVIDAINVDLKSFDDKYYKKVLKGKLQYVLDNLVLIKQNNIWLEITTLIIPDINDSSDTIKKMAQFIYNNIGENTPWHLSAFHPDYKMNNHPATKISSLQNAYNIAKDEGLKYVYIGNTSLPNNTQCSKCGFDIIIRQGYNIQNNMINNQCPKCTNIIDGIF